jgi:hypothetical protein
MGSLEDRLRRLDRLEEQVIRVPSVDEYLDASNREEVRALHTLAKRLEKYGYDGGTYSPITAFGCSQGTGQGGRIGTGR